MESGRLIARAELANTREGEREREREEEGEGQPEEESTRDAGAKALARHPQERLLWMPQSRLAWAAGNTVDAEAPRQTSDRGQLPGAVPKIEKRAPTLRFASAFHHGDKDDKDDDDEGENADGGLSRRISTRIEETTDRRSAIEDTRHRACWGRARRLALSAGTREKEENGGEGDAGIRIARIDRRDEKDASGGGKADAYNCSISPLDLSISCL